MKSEREMVGWLRLAAAQNLCASTFIAALRHSEVKFGLTLCVWRSLSVHRFGLSYNFLLSLAARRDERNILTHILLWRLYIASSLRGASERFLYRIYSRSVYLADAEAAVCLSR